jgi:hypothetical protein
MENKKTTGKGIKSLYIGGHMLNYGSQLQRTMEREKAEEIGVKLYNPMDNKDINDKQANKNDTGLAERIVVADTNAILYSDVIMIEPDPSALGTITELGQIYMFNMMYDIIDDILNNEDLSDRGKINAIKKFYEEHPRKFVMPHMQDVRRHDAPEVGDRRSWGCNAYVYGVCLDLTDGKGFYEYDEIWDKLKEMTDEPMRQNEDKKEDVKHLKPTIALDDLKDVPFSQWHKTVDKDCFGDKLVARYTIHTPEITPHGCEDCICCSCDCCGNYDGFATMDVEDLERTMLLVKEMLSSPSISTCTNDVEVGDIIVIKDLDSIKQDSNYVIDLDGVISVMDCGIYFTDEMAESCGKGLEVVSVTDGSLINNSKLYKVKDQDWTYSDSMIAYIVKGGK